MKASFPAVAVTLVEASGGVFEVEADGLLVFSKRATGRHAAPGEIIENMRNA